MAQPWKLKEGEEEYPLKKQGNKKTTKEKGWISTKYRSEEEEALAAGRESDMNDGIILLER
jgi:hypothetical protein